MKKESPNSEVRSPNQKGSTGFEFGSSSPISKLLRISNFRFRIFTFWLVLLALRAYPATNEDDLAKLRPPRVEIPPTFWERYNVWIIIGALVFLALIGIIIWIVSLPKPPIIVPAEIRAIQALDLLLSKPEDGQVLSQVSQILRRYIAEAFALPPGELTTTEFCRLIGSHEGIGNELAGTLSEFLHQCDERKFMPSPPSTPMTAIATALKLVETAQARLADLRRRAQQVPAK